MTRASTRACSPLEAFAAELGYPMPDEAMRWACGELLRKSGQEHGPVALRPLLERLGARREDLALPTPGRLEIDSEGWRICVRAGTPWRRARFTIAHEIGHILLYETLAGRPAQVRALQAPEHWAAVERLCNQAAAELLMPGGAFVRSTRVTGIAPLGLRALYDRFLVSWEPLLVRVTELFAVSLLTWRRYRRHGGERETLRLARTSRDRATWLPEGITARYVRPDVVTAASHSGYAWAERALLDLGERWPRQASAAAVSLPAARAVTATMPQPLDGFVAPEEPPAPFEVALLLAPRVDEPWGAILKHSSAQHSLIDGERVP
ncbi:MAG: hypothetical protein JWO74_1577 [Solirubrobacterales bacterium]|nr:hypothetical protein [Solirubrobacterales bacterium]